MKLLLTEHFESKNLLKEFNLLKDEEIKQIYLGLKWTSGNCLQTVVIGGVAIVSYFKESRALTPDLDFLVHDLEKLKVKLDNDGILYKELKGSNGIIGINVPKFNTDYLTKDVGNKTINKLIIKTSRKTLIGGYDVQIIIPELLAIMKLELGRDKDINDGLKLINSGVLNKELYLEILNKLKPNLIDYEAFLSYAILI